MSKHSDYSKTSKNAFSVEEHHNLYANLSVAVGLALTIRSKAMMKRRYTNHYG